MVPVFVVLVKWDLSQPVSEENTCVDSCQFLSLIAIVSVPKSDQLSSFNFCPPLRREAFAASASAYLVSVSCSRLLRCWLQVPSSQVHFFCLHTASIQCFTSPFFLLQFSCTCLSIAAGLRKDFPKSRKDFAEFFSVWAVPECLSLAAFQLSRFYCLWFGCSTFSKGHSWKEEKWREVRRKLT